jgi:hypothetical protein
VSLVVLSLWQFPTFWYTSRDAQLSRTWFNQQRELPDWRFSMVPVAKSAESVLAADELLNGEFQHRDGRVIRVFSAKRYSDSQNEIGLFAHTPDRCRSESGWKIEPIQPEFKQVTVDGVPLHFERRVFTTGTQRELVCFAGLVGGQPLPYRLDHNLSIGMRLALRAELGIDSLDLAEIVVAIEKQVGISLFDLHTPPRTWEDVRLAVIESQLRSS